MKTVQIDGLKLSGWKGEEALRVIRANLEAGWKIYKYNDSPNFTLQNPDLSPVLFSCQMDFGFYTLSSNYVAPRGEGRNWGTGARLVDEFGGIMSELNGIPQSPCPYWMRSQTGNWPVNQTIERYVQTYKFDWFEVVL